MKQTTNLRLPLVLALAAALSASPALAQQKGKGPEKKRERPELVRRQKGQSEKAAEARRKAAEKEQKARAKELRQERERRDDRLDDLSWGDYGRWEDGARREGRRTGRDVPPGWCIGKGNPHNTPENCGYGYGSWGYEDDRWYGDRRGGSGRYDSYEDAHYEFHRVHDRQCQARAAERPLDISWQIQVRSECKQRHDDWHYRAGRPHS